LATRGLPQPKGIIDGLIFFNPPIAFLLAMTLHAQDVGDGDAKSKPINLWMIYRLVNKHSYGKWPFIADLPIKECVFP
jgi:hypothetical protein